jgi:hypothetical protein
VAGERLLSDPDSATVAALVAEYPKALGLDMESAGVGRAVLGLQREGIWAQLTVIRGVSDLIDKANTDNQRMRDDWKPYAARVAVGAALGWIRNASTSQGVLAAAEPSVPGAPTVTLPAVSEPVAHYAGEVRAWLQAQAQPSARPFHLDLTATEHRPDVTAAPPPGTLVERGEVLDLVRADRTMLIFGPSGAGKSVLLNQVLCQLAPDDDPLAVLSTSSVAGIRGGRQNWLSSRTRTRSTPP